MLEHISEKITESLNIDKISLQQKVDQIIINHCELGGVLAQEAVCYHLSSGGGRTRAKMAFGIARSIGIEVEDCLKLAACAESLHNASLIHDDLQDTDAYRRSMPSLWSKFDKNTAVSVGDLMISAAYGILAELNTSQIGTLIHLVHRRLSETVNGQQHDLRITSKNIQLEEYILIATNKSAPLFSLSLELGYCYCALDSQVTVVSEAGYSFATAYQLFDDYCDREEDLISNEKNAFNIIRAKEQSASKSKQYLYNLITQYLDNSRQKCQAFSLQSSQVLLECINRLQCQIDQVF